MFWVLIYIATNFLAPIALISVGIDDFLSEFPPTSTNSLSRFSQKSASQKKPAHRPAKAGPAHPLVNATSIRSSTAIFSRPRLAASHSAAKAAAAPAPPTTKPPQPHAHPSTKRLRPPSTSSSTRPRPPPPAARFHHQQLAPTTSHHQRLCPPSSPRTPA
jgi:hypothetical protein